MPEQPRFRRSANWFRLQVRARRLFDRFPIAENQKIYIITLLIGILCGIAAVAFHQLLEFLQNNIIYAVAAQQSGWRLLGLILIPALGGLIAGVGLTRFAPEAVGSGIPQVKAAFYLDWGRIPARVIPGKMLLSSLNIGTGASLGREGPTVQICAAIASLLGRLFAISRRRLQSLVPVGAAAGLAAAFNTPIAAVTFTLEEILGNSAARPLGSIVVASVIASVIERAVMGEHPLFQVPPYRLNKPIELLFYAILGVLAGLASLAFNTGLLRLRRYSLRQKRVPQWATAAIGGLALGVIGLVALLLTGSASVFGVGYKELSSQLRESLPLTVLVILAVSKLVGTVVCYATGSSGGIFGPSLYIGGMLGGAVGLVTRAVLGDPRTQPGAFALVGMGAVFGGIVRAPVTSIIIIFEMTQNYSIILPLMVANITSYVLATRFSPTPIYDALLEQDQIHLPHTQRVALKRIFVSEAMTRELETVNADMTVSEAFTYVQKLPVYHHAYPVLRGEGRLVGIVTFNDLKRALASGRSSQPVGSIVNRNVVHAHPDHTLDAAMVKMGRRGISQLPVVSRRDTSKILGLITANDVAGAISRTGSESENGEIDEGAEPA